MIELGILQTNDYYTFNIHSLADGTLINTVIGYQNVKNCLPGDIVEIQSSNNENQKTNKYNLSKRANYPLLTGVVELTSKYKYGMTSRGIPIYRVVPLNKGYPAFIVGCSHRDVTKNILVTFRFESWEPNTTMPRGNIQEILGICGDRDAEEKALLSCYAPYKFNTKDIQMAKKYIEAFNIIDNNQKEDDRIYTPSPTFNIDPLGCKDVDDVLSVEMVGKNLWKLWITISDVSEFVKNESEFDQKAKMIGQTTYLNGSVVRPMLPPEISENVCSLVPNVKRKGVSLVITFTNVVIINMEWKLTNVIVTDAYTYETAEVQLDKDILDALQTFSRLAYPEKVNGTTPPDTHTIIESCMIFYNKEVAKIIKLFSKGILRRHEENDLQKLQLYEAICPDVIIPLASKAAEPCLPTETNTAHYGLKCNTYCHATSPLRRYADLVNQRVLKAYIQMNMNDIDPVNWQQIYQLKLREKATKHFERNMFFLDKIFAQAAHFDLKQQQILATLIDAKVKSENGRIHAKLWIRNWNRIVSWKTNGTISENGSIILVHLRSGIQIETYIGDNLSLQWFSNMQEPQWGNRIIFELIL